MVELNFQDCSEVSFSYLNFKLYTCIRTNCKNFARGMINIFVVSNTQFVPYIKKYYFFKQIFWKHQMSKCEIQ